MIEDSNHVDSLLDYGSHPSSSNPSKTGASTYLSMDNDCDSASAIALGPPYSNAGLEEYPLMNESVNASGIEDFPLSDSITGEPNIRKGTGNEGLLE